MHSHFSWVSESQMNLLACFTVPSHAEPSSVSYWIPQCQHHRNFQTCCWSSEAAVGRSVLFSVKLLNAEHFVRLITVRWVKRFCWSKHVAGKTPVAIKPCESNVRVFLCLWHTSVWQDLHDVVGIKPSFLARAGLRNSTCHTSFHAAFQICGIRHTHTLTIVDFWIEVLFVVQGSVGGN